MVKLNAKVKLPPVLTHEGTPAVRIHDPELQLRRVVMASMLWEDQFYIDGELSAQIIAETVRLVDAAKIIEIAIEAREKQKLRHIPLFLLRELARRKPVPTNLAKAIERVIQRPDELAEFLAIYWKDGKTPVAAQVKKGLAKAFRKFDAYQLAKYDRDGAIKLRDVLFLVHAEPKAEDQAATWKKLAAKELESPDTWEVAISAARSAEEKRAQWSRLLTEGKLGALALLRNLRNMTQAGVSIEAIRDALGTMKTERVLPFRFIAAARAVPQIENELEAPMFRCLASVERLPGRTALVVDTSPSMWQAKISEKSDMTRFDAAAALAVLLREIATDIRIYAFNERAHVVPPRRGFALRDALAATQAGASRGGLAVEMANADGYDRIIVLTDGQWHPMRDQVGYGTSLASPHEMSPAPLTDKAFMLNVAAYQNGVAGAGKWLNIDGWSESVIDYIRATETPAASSG